MKQPERLGPPQQKARARTFVNGIVLKLFSNYFPGISFE